MCKTVKKSCSKPISACSGVNLFSEKIRSGATRKLWIYMGPGGGTGYLPPKLQLQKHTTILLARFRILKPHTSGD